MKKEENEKPHPGLQSLRNLDLEPSPYLAARIQANLKSQQENKKASKWMRWLWPSLSAGLAAMLAVVLFTRVPSPDQVVAYNLDQPYLIRVDIRALEKTEIAYAEITLGDEKIQFASGKFADVQETKKLVISWEQMMDKQYLPIVVQGVRSGMAQVTVHFYDKNDKLMTTKEMTLSFKGKNI